MPLQPDGMVIGTTVSVTPKCVLIMRVYFVGMIDVHTDVIGKHPVIVPASPEILLKPKAMQSHTQPKWLGDVQKRNAPLRMSIKMSLSRCRRESVR